MRGQVDGAAVDAESLGLGARSVDEEVAEGGGQAAAEPDPLDARPVAQVRGPPGTRQAPPRVGNAGL